MASGGGFFYSIGAVLRGRVRGRVQSDGGCPRGGGGASGSWGASGGGAEGPRDGRYEQKDELVALMKRENPGVAQDRLRWEIETDDTLSRSCHSLVHEIAREAYEEYTGTSARR